MKCASAFNSLMSTAAFLLPLMAGADSHLSTPSSNGTLYASAHVDFKIVIPQVLSLQTAGGQRVAIMSNSRNISLSAGTHTNDIDVRNHGNVILSAVAGHVIAQDAECAELPHRDAKLLSRPLVCTASMP